MTAAPADTAPLTFDRPGQLERSAGFSRDDTSRPLILPDPAWTPEQTAAWLGTRARDGRVPYTRVTTFVEALLEGTALGRWKMRRVALGMGRRPDYVVAAAALTAEDRDKKALNDLAEKALEAAGPNAADIGTALHQFTERIDRGEPLEYVPEQYARDLDAYREQVRRITWLHREEPMVCDQLETAGTPDGIGLVDEPDPDGVVGPPRIIDLKTGNVEYTAGKFSAQLGTYANSALYDPATGARTPVADLDRRWGVVLHMPAGLGSAELRWLNIEHGWLGAQLSGPIRKWRTVSHGDLMRPLVAPEPRTVPDGKCAGRKRDGEPCTYKAVASGFCGRHQDQVGTDPDAPVNARTRAAMDQVREALNSVPEPLRVEQPATVVLEDDALENRLDAIEQGELQPEPVPSTAVEPAVDGARCGRTELLVEQCACLDHRPDLVATAQLLESGELRTWSEDGPRELPEPEQQGNPTPHSSMATPEDAEEAAKKAELALMDQVRACRTAGELQTLWQATGRAWTDTVKKYATRHRQMLPELARQERVGAALLTAIAAAKNGSELHQLYAQNRAEWADEHTHAARERARQVPPF